MVGKLHFLCSEKSNPKVSFVVTSHPHNYYSFLNWTETSPPAPGGSVVNDCLQPSETSVCPDFKDDHSGFPPV